MDRGSRVESLVGVFIRRAGLATVCQGYSDPGRAHPWDIWQASRDDECVHDMFYSVV